MLLLLLQKEKTNMILQYAISSIPSNESYALLGDFNAHVTVDDQWCDERGPFGYGELNEAGEELLSFRATNVATVCNIRFMKKNIHKQTWQHPKSQK